MNTALCNIGAVDDAVPSLSFNDKLSVVVAVSVSLVFSGGLASLAVHLLTHL